MQTSFDDWLAALRLAGKGPVVLPAAARGLAFNEAIELDGDWSGAVLTGSLTDAPGNAAIVDFAVTGGAYDPGTDKTTWMIELPAGDGDGSTGDADLPADDDADGVTYIPFALQLTPSGGDTELLCGGIFTLLETS